MLSTTKLLPSSTSSSSKKARTIDLETTLIQNSQDESPLIWKQGSGPTSTGSVLVKLAQSGYTREAHQIISLSRSASLVGRDSDGGLPELWNVMGNKRGKRGITRLMAVAIVSGPRSSQRALALIRDHNANVKEKDDSERTALHHALGMKAVYFDPWPAATVNTDLIRILVKADPSAVQEKHPLYDRYPLHIACKSKAPLAVIRLLFNMFPDVVTKKDADGKLPLHFACSANAPETIFFLLSRYPESVSEKDNEGNLPLHLCMKSGVNATDLKKLLVAHPSGLKTTNNAGRLPIHCAASQSTTSPEVMKLLIELHPESVRIAAGDYYKELPIHTACRSQSLNTITVLAKAYPEGLKMENYNKKTGNTPLSIALYHKAHFDVVKFLCDICPEAVRIPNYGNLPIHFATKWGLPFDIFKILYVTYPTGLTLRTSGDFQNPYESGFLPLHLACLHDSSFKVIDFLSMVYPEAVTEKDADGCTPLHLCMNMAPEVIVRVVKALIARNPEAVKVKDKRGRTPLNVACSYSSPFEVVKLLLASYPGGVQEKDCNNNYPLHSACFGKGDYDVVKYLADLYPPAVKEKNKDHFVPVLAACMMVSDPAAIKLLADLYPEGLRIKSKDGSSASEIM